MPVASWTPPYRVKVTDLVQPGTNRVEIEVVTTWMNRLIGDSGLPRSRTRDMGTGQSLETDGYAAKIRIGRPRFVWKQFSNKKSRLFHLPSAKIRFPQSLNWVIRRGGK